MLLQNLELYGIIRGLCNDCFRNYLGDRQQIVKYNSTYPENKSIKCEVPQGSIQGPLLFLLYTNDIHTYSNLLFFILFADDNNLFFSGKNIGELETLVNSEIKRAQVRLEDNQLTLNLKKTNYIIIFKSHKKKYKKELKIALNEYEIKKVTNPKVLGSND